MCRKPVDLERLTSEHPQAPEMIRAVRPGSWAGVLLGDDGSAKLLVCCSKSCAVRFATEGDETWRAQRAEARASIEATVAGAVDQVEPEGGASDYAEDSEAPAPDAGLGEAIARGTVAVSRSVYGKGTA